MPCGICKLRFMADDIVTINARLSSVSEVSFMMSPGKLSDDTKQEVRVGFSNQIIPDVEQDIFTLIFGVRYELAGEPILECVYRFVFEVKNLAQFIVLGEDRGSITVSSIMPHFLSVAVGTMRGILVVKTAGTNIARYPLPMVNIDNLNDALSKQG